MSPELRKNEKIIINATALNQGGALSILRQFIQAIPDDGYEYILFVSGKFSQVQTGRHILLVAKNNKSYVQRFIWDAIGVKAWLRRNRIKPLATISLQNTNFRTDRSVPNFIYYHQPIPLFNNKWNPISSPERLLWFYKNIYPFFVKIFINKNTEIFVQINFIRARFAEYFSFPDQKIHIISPKIDLPVPDSVKPPRLDRTKLNLFYPASLIVYKNHAVILKALSLLDPEIQNKIVLHLTCNESDIEHLLTAVKVNFTINCSGKISFKEVLELYNESDALLFPSYIETFGLPLLEAASFGLPIIAADMPYSREVLKGYGGVSYASFDNPGLWSESILRLFSHKGERFQPFTMEPSGSWQELFIILKNKIQTHV